MTDTVGRKTSRMGVDKLKKETIGILFVCLCLVVGGMFALWITTAPADGEDEWVYLTPITEDATATITINHTTNATVIPVWGTLPVTVAVRNKSIILENFTTVYLLAQYHEFPIRERDGNAVKSHVTFEIRFWFVASDGPIVLSVYETKLRTEKASVWGGHFYRTTEHDADQTTYTFHYSEIIGWEDP